MATISTISTTARMARAAQKSGRCSVGAEPRGSGALAGMSAQECRYEKGRHLPIVADRRRMSQSVGSVRGRLGIAGGREQGIFQAEQRRDVFIAMPLFHQSPVMDQRHLDEGQLYTVPRGHGAA